MIITQTDLRRLFTQALVSIYKERNEPTAFLRSFFPEKIEGTKQLSIAVIRGTEKVAVDVVRGTIGNRNTFSRSTQKVFIPPYHREYFDATELDVYDWLMTAKDISASMISNFSNQVAEEMKDLVSKIERAHEIQCSEVLQTGIVQLAKDTNIDFKRKAASLVDLGGGNYWVTGSVSPYATLELGAKFLREEGKSSTALYNVIMGTTAYTDFVNNDIVQKRADIRRFNLDDIAAPQRNSVGASFNGMVSAGSYQFAIWTYPQVFDNAAGDSTPYIGDKNIVILPQTPKFVFGFGAVPQLPQLGGGVRKGKFIFGDYVDERASTHDFDVKSAGLAIPVAIDQIFTAQVVA